jgi:hypothetical protein
VKAHVTPPIVAFAAHMRDVVYVAITLGFFALAGLFVRGCARIVGPDDPSLGGAQDGVDADEGTTAAERSVTA